VFVSTVLGTPRSHDDGPVTPAGGTDVGRRRGPRLPGDLVAVLLVAGLVTAASLVGWAGIHQGIKILVDWPPLLADWEPHFEPGGVTAVVVALLVVVTGPAVAARLRWGALLALAYVVSAGWTFGLALIDGYDVGVVSRLGTPTEYLVEVNRFPGLGPFLQTFVSRIAGISPTTLVTHSSGHPPLATLIYVWIGDVIGPGPETAGLVTLLVGASAPVAVAVAVGALGGVRFGPVALPLPAETVAAGRDLARRYLPFGVLFPGAVWVGVSADGLLAAVFAWGVAFLALGAVRRRVGGAALSLLGGVVLGGSLFLSYGLATAGLVPIAVAVLVRRWVPLAVAAVGAAAVVVTFLIGGFWWYDGYQQVTIRYYQYMEYGLLRPYSYWVWADLAAFALVLGPAVVAALRRLAWWPGRAPLAMAFFVGAVLIAVASADLSGLSKAEVERIWLPFATWAVLACALLPARSVRWWLLAQAALAITVNSLLLTTW
jgi:methylthioxylose transferase